MPDFNKRSYQKELLDGDDIPFKDILVNMDELNTVNHYLGGHQITCKGLSRLVQTSPASEGSEWLICEIGCGNGNNLAVLHMWCKRHGINASFIGIDINPHCIASADHTRTDGRTEYIVSDYSEVVFARQPDIIFSSLFCHHFTDEQLISQLTWLRKNSRVGFFINDLHRHPLAYHSIKLLTAVLSKSYLVKHDAPLSVLRGFSHQDWLQLFRKCSIDKFSIKWCWAFRWLIVIVN